MELAGEKSGHEGETSGGCTTETNFSLTGFRVTGSLSLTGSSGKGSTGTEGARGGGREGSESGLWSSDDSPMTWAMHPLRVSLMPASKGKKASAAAVAAVEESQESAMASSLPEGSSCSSKPPAAQKPK